MRVCMEDGCHRPSRWQSDDGYPFCYEHGYQLYVGECREEGLAPLTASQWISRWLTHGPTGEEAPAERLWYVNVYEVDRCYGGPEEGGWWFDAGHQIKSDGPWLSKRTAEQAREVLIESYPNNGYRYSVRPSDTDFAVKVEDHEGRNWPEERPHYE